MKKERKKERVDRQIEKEQKIDDGETEQEERRKGKGKQSLSSSSHLELKSMTVTATSIIIITIVIKQLHRSTSASRKRNTRGQCSGQLPVYIGYPSCRKLLILSYSRVPEKDSPASYLANESNMVSISFSLLERRKEQKNPSIFAIVQRLYAPEAMETTSAGCCYCWGFYKMNLEKIEWAEAGTDLGCSSGCPLPAVDLLKAETEAGAGHL